MRRIEQLARDDRAVSKLQSDLVVERRELALRSDEIAAMRRQAEAAEAVARGAMDTARTAALKLTNRQLSELRSMRKPPESVLVIMEALRLLFEDLPSSTKKQPARAQDWSHHKLILKNPRQLRSRLKALDVHSLGPKRVHTLRQTLGRHEVSLRTIPRLSFVCQALAKYLLAVCSSWQAAQDLRSSQQAQQAANERYDANAQAIIGLEEQVEANRERLAELQKHHEEQVSLQHNVASAHAAAKDKLEQAESDMLKAELVLRGATATATARSLLSLSLSLSLCVCTSLCTSLCLPLSEVRSCPGRSWSNQSAMPCATGTTSSCSHCWPKTVTPPWQARRTHTSPLLSHFPIQIDAVTSLCAPQASIAVGPRCTLRPKRTTPWQPPSCCSTPVHILPNSRYPARTHSRSLIAHRMFG